MALFYLTYLGIILLVAVLCSIVSNKIKVPNVLLLILVGFGLNQLTYQGEKLISFPPEFLTSIAILALAIIVFDSSSRLKLKELDDFSFKALKLTGLFFVLNLTLLTMAAYLIFDNTILVALLFASLMSGTSPDVVLSILQQSKNKAVELLKIESIINTPLTVLLPFIVFDLIKQVEATFSVTAFISQILPFLQQIVAGIGSGIVVGLVVFKIMKKYYSARLSPIAVIASTLLTYILAENLKGNGVLAVSTLGLLFGTFYVKEKEHLLDFSLVFSNLLEILVFVFVGLMMSLPFSYMFYVKSLALFSIFLGIRYISVYFSFSKENSLKEIIFMTLNVPKGIAVAVVVFTFLSMLSETALLTISPVIEYSLAFLLYSIILSTVVSIFSSYFIGARMIK